ncbi:hypothetical protein CTI12_AA469100 [Artemisia annua]|uniref:Protein root UVB sensitive/RUS domain-containing protein n=1 Tax=Artemisia annua TaxID=35608 RepID=A0A2U1LP87_ARTAN|nr:hypothetical protein CTI12_AA469100 [Artemisia annua]
MKADSLVVGVSEDVFAIAAAVLDGSGRIGKMLFSRQGKKFDYDLKQSKHYISDNLFFYLRLSGDLLMELGAGVELATAAAPHLFLPLACAANVAKNVAAVTSTSTRTPIYKAFAKGENIGDVTAKGECVGNFADLLPSSMSCGTILSPTTVKRDGSQTEMPNLLLHQWRCQPAVYKQVTNGKQAKVVSTDMACSKKRSRENAFSNIPAQRHSKMQTTGTDIPFSEMPCSKKRAAQTSNDGTHMCRTSKSRLPNTDVECYPSEKLDPLPIKNKGSTKTATNGCYSSDNTDNRSNTGVYTNSSFQPVTTQPRTAPGKYGHCHGHYGTKS